MADHLVTRVKSCETADNFTSLLLQVAGIDGMVSYTMPQAVKLREGDHVVFQYGILAGLKINHDDYHRADFYRGDSTDVDSSHRGEDPFLSVMSRDYRILQELRDLEMEVDEQREIDLKSSPLSE